MSTTVWVFKVLNEDWRPMLAWCEDNIEPTYRQHYDWWWRNGGPGSPQRFCDMDMVFADPAAAMLFKLQWNDRIISQQEIDIE